MLLSGSICYVTGCENLDGIGHALVVRLLKEGAKVFAVDRAVSNLQQHFADEIQDGTLATLAVDVTDWAAYRASFNAAVTKFAKLSAVFLNAGVYEPKGFWDDAEETNYLTLEVNSAAVFKGTRIAVDQFLRQDEPGLIVVTGSTSSQLAIPKTPLYCASKWAVEGFVRSMGFLDAEANIRVVVLQPGVIKTSFWEQIGVDKNIFSEEDATSIPSIVEAWMEIIRNPTGIPGGSAYEITALGARRYDLDSPRTQSANKNRNAGNKEIVRKLRENLKVQK